MYTDESNVIEFPRPKAQQPLGLLDYFILLSLLPLAFGLTAASAALLNKH